MPFETGFIALRKYLRWPTQLLASVYSRFYCHICHGYANLLAYNGLMVAIDPISIVTLLSPYCHLLPHPRHAKNGIINWYSGASCLLFVFLFIGTLGASTEQNKGFCVQYSPFFRLFITKNGSEAYFWFKKSYFELQKRLFRTSKEPYLIMGRMLLKLRHDVAVTASGCSYCYVVT